MAFSATKKGEAEEMLAKLHKHLNRSKSNTIGIAIKRFYVDVFGGTKTEEK